jgi:urea transport system substrate-binding protein
MTERTIFLAALDVADPAERTAYVERACAGDSALRRRVEALLAAHEREGTFLEVPALAQMIDATALSPANEAAAARSPIPDKPGETQAEQPSNEPIVFLTPSRNPDSLGRLDHYEVLKVVGQGGMGVVFKAFDEKLHRVVAIKALAPQLTTSDTARQRFVREAQAAAAVAHENVIDVHVVEDAGAVPYLVMQFIEGRSLEDKIRQGGPLPLRGVLRIGAQIASGLAAAHAKGLIHRDVTPANILLEDGTERVKITDFGLARAAADASRTHSGLIAGTPLYMSPEQANGQDVDQRSDLFSLGSVLYAMCTGQPPFRAEKTVSVLKRVRKDTPPPIREINPNIPDWLAAMVVKLHAKEPAQRFQSAAEVAELFGQHLAQLHQPHLVAPPVPAGQPTSGPADTEKRRPRVSLPPRLLVGLSAVLVLVGSLAGYLIYGNRGDGPAVANARPIRVGILHSQTGTMGTSESAAIDATLLAVEEINANGGLLGRRIEPVVVDGMSDWPTYAQEAERLITAERVCTIFGCWTSASRKAVTPIVEKYDHLLIYPMQYEGLEQSPNVVYTGALPNQQVTPAVRWCCDHLGKRFFICGSDYVWPRATSEVIRDVVAEWGGEIVGEEYVPLESVEVEAVVQKIRQTKPEVILEMVAGDSKVAYYRALRRAGITPDKIPSVSFSSPQPGLATRDVAGDYAAWNYFESIDSSANRAFVARFRAKFGPQRTLSDPLEASYLGVYLWAQAVQAAGREDVAAIRRALCGQRFQAPEGEVRVDPDTQHLWKTARVARITSKGAAQIVWTSGEPVRPVPFPASRSREQWEGFVTQLRQRWGGQWASPSR